MIEGYQNETKNSSIKVEPRPNLGTLVSQGLAEAVIV